MAVAGRQVAVLGAGSWGTALANHLSRAGHRVRLWGRDAAVVSEINRDHFNTKYFPGLTLAPTLRGSDDLAAATSSAEYVVLSLPSSVFKGVAEALKTQLPSGSILVSATKGLEAESGCTMSQLLTALFPLARGVATLSGPSFAREVLLGLPTAVTVASVDQTIAAEVAKLFHFDTFRVYTSDDTVGVEFGGVIKNVIALAAGVVDGAGMGSNARAALITRGVAEMQRLIVALGGKGQTVAGLSGLGDLLLTATGDLSRNRRVGLALGRGEVLESAVHSVGQTAEGVAAAGVVLDLAKNKGVQCPIVEEVAKLVSGRSSVRESIAALLARPQRGEG